MEKNDKILHYKNRAYAYGYRYSRCATTAEDIAQDAILDYLERINRGCREETLLFELCLKESLRKYCGRKGTRQREAFLNRKNQISISTNPHDEFNTGTICEDRIASNECPEPSVSESRVDPELMLRIDQDFFQDEGNIKKASELGVSTSRISQLKKGLIREYLWEHYKEYGIESEIEVDWIVL